MPTQGAKAGLLREVTAQQTLECLVENLNLSILRAASLVSKVDDVKVAEGAVRLKQREEEEVAVNVAAAQAELEQANLEAKEAAI